MKVGDVYYHEIDNSIAVLEVNLLIDPPHDHGKYELQSSDCRYTASTETSFKKMGWTKIGIL